LKVPVASSLVEWDLKFFVPSSLEVKSTLPPRMALEQRAIGMMVLDQVSLQQKLLLLLLLLD
jgi:hypothetical protein